jgi:uncharacterized protein (TIGR03435 family)
MREGTCAIGAALLLMSSLSAQTFDVASLKRSAPNNPNGSIFEYRSVFGLRVENSTLRGLIESAYHVRDFQIAGGGSWISADRYDVLGRSQPSETAVSRAEDIRATVAAASTAR